MTDDQAPGDQLPDEASAPADPVAPAPTPADRTGEWDIPGARMAALSAYLEVNRERFTRAALERAAADAGYTPAEIAKAWSGLEKGGSGDPSRPRVRAGVAFLTFVAWLAAVWLVGALLSNLDVLSRAGLPVGVLVWAGSGLVGAVIWLTQRHDRPSLATGVGLGVLIIVLLPLILILVVLGICLASGFSLLGN